MIFDVTNQITSLAICSKLWRWQFKKRHEDGDDDDIFRLRQMVFGRENCRRQICQPSLMTSHCNGGEIQQWWWNLWCQWWHWWSYWYSGPVMSWDRVLESFVTKCTFYIGLCGGLLKAKKIFFLLHPAIWYRLGLSISSEVVTFRDIHPSLILPCPDKCHHLILKCYIFSRYGQISQISDIMRMCFC